MTGSKSQTTVAAMLLNRAKEAGRLARYDGAPCAPPSFAADQMQTAWISGWDEINEVLKTA